MKKAFFIFFYIINFIGYSNGQYTKLLDFVGTTNGSLGTGSLISDSNFLYGMTYRGGTNDFGTVFKIKHDGSAYLKLLDFVGTTNGSYPNNSLLSDGTYLYGMTSMGGINNFGTVFKIKCDGSGFVKLLDFTDTTGSYPFGSLISDSSYLYGMTSSGGTNDWGTIFKIKLDGSSYLKLLDFTGPNGIAPNSSFYFDGAFLYGTTMDSDSTGFGTIFKIKTDGTGYVKLYDFAGIADGIHPYGSLISDGTFLYGTTAHGGINGWGTIFKIKPDGSAYAKLYDFAGSPDGVAPFGTLSLVGNFLYGMTMFGGINDSGIVFKIRTDGSDYNKLLDFVGIANGSIPYTCALLSEGAFLYGMTELGGTQNKGVVFKLALSVGIEEICENHNIFIYPNPTNDNITIENTLKKEDAVLSIYDIQGRLLLNQFLKQQKTEIDISNFSKGICFVTVQSDNGIITKKIIKE